MNIRNLFKADKYRGLFLGGMILLLPIISILAWHAPIQADEQVHINHAIKVDEYFKTGGENRAALNDPENLLHHYGQTFDYLVHKFNNALGIEKDYYKSRHLFTSWMTWLCILFAGLIAAKVANWRTALLTGILLVFTPRFLGHGLNNSLDIPFATGFTLFAYGLIRMMTSIPKINWKDVVLMIIGFGLAFGIRAGGLLIIPTTLFFLLLALAWGKSWKQIRSSEFQNRLTGYLLVSIIVIIAGYLIGIWRWPYALRSILSSPWESLDALSQISNRIRVLFNGEHYWSSDLPSSYYLKFLWISNPLFVPVSIGLGLWMIYRKKIQFFNPSTLLIGFLALFPLAYIIYQSAGVYNGWRHILFIYPFLAILMAMSWNHLFNRLAGKRIYIGYAFLAILIVLPTLWMLNNRPYHYIYFNEVFGNVEAAHGKFQTDYYQTSIPKAIDELQNEIDEQPIKLATNGARVGQAYIKQERITNLKVVYTNFYQRDVIDWDYAIFYSDFLATEHFGEAYWPPKGTIKTIEVGGAPVAVIIKRENRDALYAETYLESEQLDSALSRVNSAIRYDPNTANNYYLKGEILVDLERYDEAVVTYKQAIKKHSELSAAYIRAAALLIQSEQYEEAIDLLGKLLTKFPEDINGSDLMAKAYFKQGKKAEAMSVYEHLVMENPDNPTGYILAGEMLLEDSMIDAAASWFGKATDLEPGNPYALARLGECLVRAGRASEGLPYLENAYQIEPAIAGLPFFLGKAHEELNSIEEAMDWYFESIKFETDYYPAYENLALLLAKAKDFETAFSVLDEAIKNELGEERPYNVAASIALVTGDDKKFDHYAAGADQIIENKTKE